MDSSRGGCCIARYEGGAYVASKADRIMLRFRPIAPKPVTGGSVSGVTTENSSKPKRRCVRETKRCRKRKSPEKDKSDVAVVTLPLLPETPDRKDSPTIVPPSPSDLTRDYVPIWFSHVVKNPSVHVPRPVRPAWSCVTVECVMDTCEMDTCGDEWGMGSTEEEVKMSLEEDTCPGFISDGWDRVRWTNEAYRKMVGQSEGETVGLNIKEKMPETLQTFSCRVRLQYTCQKERNSLTVPCDVWRMGGGAYTWRLDVKAALSLGR
ncbi:uncharacterized protein LOC143862602 [Tasmannia lanceolata]|uniref:uncharacterized protein LOC143862602 n=1 Tax=Tasmannia lanceolata TaxID=3420 RepID=UPI0040648899